MIVDKIYDHEDDIKNLNTQLDDIVTRILKYKLKQQLAYSNVLSKKYNGELITVVCQGDSMTYGQDTVSTDKRSAGSDITLEVGTTYGGQTQASKTYPEALQEFSNTIFGTNKIKVVNRGYSGDWAEKSLTRWTTNPNADLHFVMLGTNDSTASIPNVSQIIGKYVTDMRKVIEQILDFGSAVVLLTPPKHSNDNHIIRESYRKALETVGNDYGIPVINTPLLMQNYPYSSVQSDSIHYNGLGYTILGAKVAGMLAGIYHIYNPLSIKNNDNIIINYEDYGFTQNGNIVFNEVGDSPLGIGATSDKGLYCNLTQNSSLTINFKAEDENLILIPLYRTASSVAGIKIDVDCGVDQGQFISSYYKNAYLRTGTFGVPTKSFSVINQAMSRMDITQETPTSLVNGSLYLANKGYYSITITNNGQDNMVYFYGFLVKNANDVRKARTKILSQTHVTTAEALTFTTPVTTNQVNPYLLYDAGTDFSNYWKLPPIKLIVHSYMKSTYEYIISVGASNNNHDWTFQEVGKALYGTDRTHDRIVQSVSWDGNRLTITWGGDTTYPSEFSLTLA